MKRVKTLALYEFQRRLFFILSTFLFLTLISYAYLLNLTIKDIVFVDENQKEMANLRSTLSTLENEYLSKGKNLTLEKAYDLGFIDAATPTYLSRATLSTELSLNTVSQ